MSRRDLAIAAALFLLACVATWADVWRAGATRAVTVQEASGPFEITTRADATFQAWLTSRHAHTWLRRPWRLFDTEHCAPAEKTLTLGIPMLTLGLVATPAAIVSDEPVLVYNLAQVLLTLLGAFAMYVLVARWTGEPAAGWVAGLLFAFQPLRIGHLTHPTVWDVSWTVWALYFAERLSAKGRWRDAAGLGAAIALQVGASFYPLLAALCLAPPFALWLLWRDRARALRPGPLLLVAGLTLLAVLAVLLPYLGAESAQGELARSRFHYLDPADLLRPGRLEFPGWCVVALVAVALCAGAGRAAPKIRGDPRPALLAGACLVVLVAAGSHWKSLVAGAISPEAARFVPNLHAALAAVLPGLDAVRGIERLGAGAGLALTLLAGLGAGAVVRGARSRNARLGVGAAALLVALAAFDVLRLPALGIERRDRRRVEEIRPDDASIAFFAELERRGDRGPLLELPISRDAQVTQQTQRILLSGFHGRRTSACFGSYRPPGREELRALADKLPAEASVRGLAGLGFTTVVVHTPPGRRDAAKVAAKLARSGLAPLHETPLHTAYRLAPPPR